MFDLEEFYDLLLDRQIPEDSDNEEFYVGGGGHGCSLLGSINGNGTGNRTECSYNGFGYGKPYD